MGKGTEVPRHLSRPLFPVSLFRPGYVCPGSRHHTLQGPLDDPPSCLEGTSFVVDRVRSPAVSQFLASRVPLDRHDGSCESTVASAWHSVDASRKRLYLLFETYTALDF